MTTPTPPAPPAPQGQKPAPGTKCRYCDKPAVVNVTPAAGGPVVPVCADHARLARKAVQSGAASNNGNGSTGGSSSSGGGNPFANKS